MVLKVVSGGGGGGSGTVTQINAGTGINVSPSPITGNGTVSLANTTVTAGTYGNASTVAQVIINSQGQVTNAVNVAISIANSAITGLGTMATQNANLVTITGGTINIPNFFSGYSSTTAANATTALTVASNHWQKTTASGTNTQIYTLPDGTTLQNGTSYIFDNDAGGNVTINDNSSGLVDTLIPGSIDIIFLESNATVAGAWGKYSWLPAYVNWGTSTADFGNVSVSNVVISGGQINVTTVNHTANTASNATFTSATMQLIPAGYINYDLNGTLVKIPYYNA